MEEQFQIFFKSYNGTFFTMKNLTNATKIKDIYLYVMKELSLHAGQVRLMFAGKLLDVVEKTDGDEIFITDYTPYITEDDKLPEDYRWTNITDYNIKKESKLEISLISVYTAMDNPKIGKLNDLILKKAHSLIIKDISVSCISTHNAFIDDKDSNIYDDKDKQQQIFTFDNLITKLPSTFINYIKFNLFLIDPNFISDLSINTYLKFYTNFGYTYIKEEDDNFTKYRVTNSNHINKIIYIYFIGHIFIDYKHLIKQIAMYRFIEYREHKIFYLPIKEDSKSGGYYNLDYKLKYLKYKNKYLKLKEGGYLYR